MPAICGPVRVYGFVKGMRQFSPSAVSLAFPPGMLGQLSGKIFFSPAYSVCGGGLGRISGNMEGVFWGGIIWWSSGGIIFWLGGGIFERKCFLIDGVESLLDFVRFWVFTGFFCVLTGVLVCFLFFVVFVCVLLCSVLDSAGLK